jgi:hypothetical protein
MISIQSKPLDKIEGRPKKKKKKKKKTPTTKKFPQLQMGPYVGTLKNETLPKSGPK